MIEETHLVLDLEYRQHGRVNLCCRNFSARDKLRQRVLECLARHVHPTAGNDGFVGSVGWIGGVSVRLKTGDCQCIGYNEASETPIPSQNVAEEPTISTRRDVIQIHIR